jgi:hypothetical protein
MTVRLDGRSDLSLRLTARVLAVALSADRVADHLMGGPRGYARLPRERREEVTIKG